MYDFVNESISVLYNNKPADERYARLADHGTEFTSEQHDACKMLCTCRNFYIMIPDIMYYHTIFDHIADIKDHINKILKDAELPPINLNGIPKDILTTKDFARSEVIYRNGEVFTPEKARHIAKKYAFEEILIIQKYLYDIDKKYGTCYLDINLPCPDAYDIKKACSEKDRLLNKYLCTLFVDEVVYKEILAKGETV